MHVRFYLLTAQEERLAELAQWVALTAQFTDDLDQHSVVIKQALAVDLHWNTDEICDSADSIVNVMKMLSQFVFNEKFL